MSAKDDTSEQKHELDASEELVTGSLAVEKNTNDEILVYDNVEEVPELHMRTWIAMASMLLLKFAELLALQGPPAVVSAYVLCHCDILISISSHTLDQASRLPKPRPGSPILFLSFRL
jgi:hypothetical protein